MYSKLHQHNIMLCNIIYNIMLWQAISFILCMMLCHYVIHYVNIISIMLCLYDFHYGISLQFTLYCVNVISIKLYQNNFQYITSMQCDVIKTMGMSLLQENMCIYWSQITTCSGSTVVDSTSGSSVYCTITHYGKLCGFIYDY